MIYSMNFNDIFVLGVLVFLSNFLVGYIFIAVYNFLRKMV